VKALAALSALALIGLAQPAAAQMMCAPGQQAQASTPAASGGMMCGGMNMTADDPMADKPAQPQQTGGMCACCKTMAMMRGGSHGGMTMPGMEPPKPQ
jgi:hypothetical protein